MNTLLADCRVPVLGICAYSGTGKTTLLRKLLPELSKRQISTAVIKHAHHDFDIDTPGKDSFEVRKAGAKQVLVASNQRKALMVEAPVDGDPDLKSLLAAIDQDQVDLILVEGFKTLPLPKLVLHRAATGKELDLIDDPNVIALACDEHTMLPTSWSGLKLDINDVDAIASQIKQFIHDWHPQPLQPFGPMEEDGARKLLSVAQGVEKILATIEPITERETVALDKALGTVLATDAISPINVPQHTNSAMDGYAFKYDPNRSDYQVVAEILAGQGFEGELKPNQAVKIMTGAPVPAQADTVVMREEAEQTDDQVSFNAKISAGQNVRQAGEDIAKGQTALKAGNRVGPAELGLIASLGLANPTVWRRPKIAIFSTGDEVCAPEEPLKTNCIFDSNRFTLRGMLTKLGCDILDLGIIEDNEAAMVEVLQRGAAEADMVLSSGGVSVGDADFIKVALQRLGHINFWRIAMRPGRPLAFGTIEGTPFFGLPGNPVAVMVSFMNFVQPAVRKLAGELSWQPNLVRATATEPLRSRLGRTEFTRGVLSVGPGGRMEVRSTGSQGSGILSSMVEANCLIVIDEPIEKVLPGELIWVHPFADLL